MNARPPGPPPPLADWTEPGLRLLLVAINPSTRSSEIGHSFASPTNAFWRLLHASGLTPRRLEPSEEHRLPSFGIGLVSVVSRATPAASDLTRAELRAGAATVGQLIARDAPRVVALLGLTLHPVFFPGRPSSGPGLSSERIHGSEVFVLPNPSGRNRAFPGFDRKLEWYRALATHLGDSPSA